MDGFGDGSANRLSVLDGERQLRCAAQSHSIRTGLMADARETMTVYNTSYVLYVLTVLVVRPRGYM
eukprot:scaffold720_cov114-Cylindrotheca_fusiformis.AAC.2